MTVGIGPRVECMSTKTVEGDDTGDMKVSICEWNWKEFRNSLSDAIISNIFCRIQSEEAMFLLV